MSRPTQRLQVLLEVPGWMLLDDDDPIEVAEYVIRASIDAEVVDAVWMGEK